MKHPSSHSSPWTPRGSQLYAHSTTPPDPGGQAWLTLEWNFQHSSSTWSGRRLSREGALAKTIISVLATKSTLQLLGGVKGMGCDMCILSLFLLLGIISLPFIPATTWWERKRSSSHYSISKTSSNRVPKPTPKMSALATMEATAKSELSIRTASFSFSLSRTPQGPPFFTFLQPPFPQVKC